MVLDTPLIPRPTILPLPSLLPCSQAPYLYGSGSLQGASGTADEWKPWQRGKSGEGVADDENAELQR